jgi:hypothetical protein
LAAEEGCPLADAKAESRDLRRTDVFGMSVFHTEKLSVHE